MHRRRDLLVAAALGLLVLTGCTAASGPHVVSSHGRYAVVDRPEQASGDAAISGALTVDMRGCWALTSANGTTRPVVWPAGTTISGTTITLPGVDRGLHAGTLISGGGGGDASRTAYAPCIAHGDDVLFIDGISVTP